MMDDLVHKYITGTTASKISSGIEQAVRAGALCPGDRLPTVRELAGALKVSPATVAAAYQSLQSRALLISQGRRGTRVSHRPLAGANRRQTIPAGAVNLADGNPDPNLLPCFDRVLRELRYQPHLYGSETINRELIVIMQREMQAEGIAAGPCCVVHGAMDGIDRLLAENLRPGDRVAVEDPGFTGHHDLIASRGLSLVPVRVDEEGILPDALARSCGEGVRAILLTPRVQSPTGAAVTQERACELRRILRQHPEVLVIEDDHASFLCEGELHSTHDPKGRWAHIRSFSKAFNPDLRLAVVTGDEATMTRLLDRLIVIERWVSHILQSTACALLTDHSVRTTVRRAGRSYDTRRQALVDALQQHGLEPMGRTGYNIWLPLVEETPIVQGLLQSGWAVAAGERFRLASSAGIRITTSQLEPREATSVATALGQLLHSRQRSASV